MTGVEKLVIEVNNIIISRISTVVLIITTPQGGIYTSFGVVVNEFTENRVCHQKIIPDLRSKRTTVNCAVESADYEGSLRVKMIAGIPTY